jgi:hypothetical protein
VVPFKWRIFKGDRRRKILLTVVILVVGYLAIVALGGL